MTSHKRKLRLSSVTVDLGCSSSLCRRPKLSSIFTPKKPKNYTKHPHRHHQSPSSTSSWQRVPADSPTFTTSSSTATWTNSYNSNSCYYNSEPETRGSLAVQGFGRVGDESVAVEKESEDPYLDFRRSMLQMIMEKQIYSKEDLKELLNCFLQLNSPYYHGIIVRAFTEIWHSVFFGK